MGEELSTDELRDTKKKREEETVLVNLLEELRCPHEREKSKKIGTRSRKLWDQINSLEWGKKRDVFSLKEKKGGKKS